MPTADINGVKLYYETSGKGKNVVMLHGYIGDTEDWSNQVALLEPNYRISVLEQRGRGRSEAPESADKYSIDIFTEDVYQWLKLLKIENCCLIGHSLGGMVALSFVLKHPEMVGALVLADTSSGGLPAPDPAAQKRQSVINNIALTQGMTAAFDYDITNSPASKKRYQQHPETMTRMRAKWGSTSAYGYINVGKAIHPRPSINHRLGEIKAPTLIIYAEHDLPFVIDGAETMHNGIAKSEMVMIENSGHGAMYEKADEFNKALNSFLKRINW